MTKYQIIYADPPWGYRDKASAGKRGASHKYDCMTLPNIMHLPVHALAEKDCVLFMWATFPMMPEALKVIEAWGFKFKTAAFVWTKHTKHGKAFFGMGNWTRANAEVCLMAIKGKPRRISASIRQHIHSEKREHSRKPDEVREAIVKLMGDLPRIELFAREKTEGWHVWGNQVECDVHLEDHVWYEIEPMTQK